MALKALSGVTQGASSFARLPNGFTRSSKLTQTLPIDAVNKASIRVVIGTTAVGTGVFNRSATTGLTIGVTASGQQTDQQHYGTATVGVVISSTASASVTSTHSGTATASIVITTTAAGETGATHAGTANIGVTISATASGTASQTHAGVASCQVNLSVSAAGFNTATQVPDETTNGNTMTLLNNPVFTSDSAIGNRAVAFDGSTVNDQAGRINTNYESVFQSPFSLSVWTKPDDGVLSGSNEYIFSAYSGNVSGVESWRWDLHQTGGKIRAGVVHYDGEGSQNESIKETTSNVYSDGAQSSYTHIVVTFDSSAVPTIYVNGSAVALTSIYSDTLSLSNYDSTNDCVSVGGIFTSSSSSYPIYSYNGKLDDIALWSTELTSTQVSNLYNSGNGTNLEGSSNLVGWWKMGDSNNLEVTHTGVATVSVAVTASADGTTSTTHLGTASCQVNISASASASVTSFNNYAISLDGSNDYAPVVGSLSAGTYNFLTSTLTYSASLWFKFDDHTKNSSQVLLANNYTGSNKGVQIWYDNRSGISTKALRVNSWAGSSVSTNTGSAISDNNWHHVLVTSSGASGTLTVYLDGSSLATASLGSVSSTAPNQDLAIGGRVISGSVNSPIDGKLDEVAIWDVALSSADATAIYNSGTPNNLTASGSYDTDRSGDLQGYWRFEENTGTSITDTSGNGNTATLTNGPTFTTDVPS